VAAALVALPAVVCTLWHAEPRYFAVVVPLAAVVLAGALAPRRLPGAAAAAALVLLGAAGLVPTARAFARLPGPCPGAVEWLARHGGDARVLTLDPWTLAWAADRETVMIPSGGVDAIARVARRYETPLLLAHAMPGRPQSSALVTRLEGRHGALRVTTLARLDGCRVARVEVVPGVAP
jgi:hypothetical protein